MWFVITGLRNKFGNKIRLAGNVFLGLIEEPRILRYSKGNREYY